MRLRLRYDVQASSERFWEVFFDPEVTRRLYLEALGSTSIEIEQQTGDIHTGLRRTVRYGQVPDAPGPVKKLFGAEVISTEEGAFDPDTGIWSFTVTPGTLWEKTDIRGSIEIRTIGLDGDPPDADGDGLPDTGSAGASFEEIFLLEAKVKIFGAGPVVERFVERQARNAQDRAAEFFNELLVDSARRGRD